MAGDGGMSITNDPDPSDDAVEAIDDAARDAKFGPPPPPPPVGAPAPAPVPAPAPAPATPSSMADTEASLCPAGEQVTGAIDGSGGCRLQGAQGVGGGLRGLVFFWWG